MICSILVVPENQKAELVEISSIQSSASTNNNRNKKERFAFYFEDTVI